MGTQRDIIMESNGHCFVCLNQTASKTNHDNIKKSSFSLQSSIYSIQSLSQYLKIDIGNALKGKKCIPLNLTRVEKADLKVELYEDCVYSVDKFTSLHRQLEKLQMEMTSSLDLIYGTLQGAEVLNKGAISLVNNMITSDSWGDWEEKLKILDDLRLDSIQKCSRRILNSSPRVRIHNLTMKGLAKEKRKLKTWSSALKEAKCQRRKQPNPILGKLSESVTATGNVKLEPQEPMSPSEDENDQEYSCDNPDWDIAGPQSPSEVKSNQREIKDDNSSSMRGDGGNHTLVRTAHLQNDKRRLPSKDTENSNFVYTISSGKGPRRKPQAVFDKKTGMCKCPLCPRQFLSANAFQLHYKTIRLLSRYNCSLCKKQFTRKVHWQDHHRGAHLGVKFNCNSCHRQFPYKQSLMRHIRKVSCGGGTAPKPKRKAYQCRPCGKIFMREHSLRRHFKEKHLSGNLAQM